MVDGVLKLTADWDYTQVSVGLPAPARSAVACSTIPSTSATGGMNPR